MYTRPTDLQKSFDGLSLLVTEKLAENPLSSQVFVFVSRRGNYLKAHLLTEVKDATPKQRVVQTKDVESE